MKVTLGWGHQRRGHGQEEPEPCLAEYVHSLWITSYSCICSQGPQPEFPGQAPHLFSLTMVTVAGSHLGNLFQGMRASSYNLSYMMLMGLIEHKYTTGKYYTINYMRWCGSSYISILPAEHLRTFITHQKTPKVKHHRQKSALDLFDYRVLFFSFFCTY